MIEERREVEHEQLHVEDTLVGDLGDKEIHIDELRNKNDDEGLIIIPRDNIISDNKVFIEDNSEHEIETQTSHTQDNTSSELVVTDIDDEVAEVDAVAKTRNCRKNEGVGVKKSQLEFREKGYGSKRGYRFTTN